MGDNVRRMRTRPTETELAVIAPSPPDKLPGIKERRAGDRRHTEPNLIDRLVGPREGDRRDERDRRATPRVEVQLECEERDEGARYFRITQDLSTFGLATRQGFPHPRGTRLNLALHLPDLPGEPVQVEAEVVGWYDAMGGTRLAFRQPSVEAVKRIHKFLTARVPELAEKTKE